MICFNLIFVKIIGLNRSIDFRIPKNNISISILKNGMVSLLTAPSGIQIQLLNTKKTYMYLQIPNYYEPD